MELSSPWIQQLNRTRPIDPLSKTISADVAIVGGGIAGIMTAYFLLQRTSHRVVLIEARRVANGATGHNAGQIVSYFERQLADLVEEYGLEMAAAGQAAIDSAWELLDEVYKTIKPATPLWRFTGYAGCRDLE